MLSFFQSAGYFSIPLAVFLFISVFVSIDRGIALRKSKLGIRELNDFLLNGCEQSSFSSQHPRTLFGKVLFFFKKNHPIADGLRSYVRFELNKLERGLFVLDIVIAAAPLVGLLGTVFGLMNVFSCFAPGANANNEVLANGIALALTTTALGLIIAIPSIVINNMINRKLDNIHATFDLLVERLIGIGHLDDAHKKQI